MLMDVFISGPTAIAPMFKVALLHASLPMTSNNSDYKFVPKQVHNNCPDQSISFKNQTSRYSIPSGRPLKYCRG